MRSNYKRLGDYIKEVKVRNTDLTATELLGVNIDKFFMPSVANIVGTDMSVYKIVKRGQFACNRMHVGRDMRLPVALSDRDYEFMVSPAYDVFEIKDTAKLLPEYLMMWFIRKEFDRNAWFYTDADVRGGLSWKALCDMQLPVPSPEKQRQLVNEYHVLIDRITINNRLIQKLEETAQAVYKQWFVDFEFPDADGKPYKSNGGEMVESEMGLIPKGWKYGTFEDLHLDVSDGNYSAKYPKSDEFKNEGIPFIRGTDFENKCINPFNLIYITSEKHSKLLKGHTKRNDILITTRGASIGKYAFITERFIGVNINSQIVRLNGGKAYPTIFLGCLFGSQTYQDMISSATTGSAQPQLSITNLMQTKLVIPDLSVINTFSSKCSALLNLSLLTSGENNIQNEIMKTLLSKLATIEN